MRILVVEDDRELLQNLKSGLAGAGFAVDVCDEGGSGAFLGDTEPYDAVVLDLGLPDVPGLHVLTDWRKSGNDVPVLILTARGAWHEKVEGFRAGADDYLTKPFHMEELVARLHALIRRRHGHVGGVVRAGAMELDSECQCIRTEAGKTVDLTGTEFRLLEYLMQHHGKVISKSRLLEHTYSGESTADENLVEVYINRLRRKLGAGSIETRRGQGYVFTGLACDP